MLWAATGDIPATRVLGQPNFVHNNLNFIDGLGLSSPSRIVQDISVSPTRFYISDTGNNRILGWKTGSSGLFGPTGSLGADDQPADLVIGQPDLFSSQPNQGLSLPTRSTLMFPGALAVDGKGNLYAVDAGNNRVLEYDSPFDQCASTPCVIGGATRVYGQNNSFVSNACSGSGAIRPTRPICVSAAAQPSILWVA